MTRNLTLAARLKEVLLDGHWIANTNYSEQLLSINWKQAIRRIDTLNTIAELVYHVNYYLSGLLDAIATGKLSISDKYSFNLPQLQSEADWKNLVDDFLKNSEQFINLVEKMDDSIFDRPFVDENYGNYLRNIEGVIEHSYYHLGQISLIRKMIVLGSKDKQ